MKLTTPGYRGIAVSMSALVVLTACAGPASSGRQPLIVHIGLFGGPLERNHQMALSNSPAAHEKVIAQDAAGERFAAYTDAAGRASLDLRPGSYTVYSTYCGTRTQHITLRAGRTAHVQIVCPVP